MNAYLLTSLLLLLSASPAVSLPGLNCNGSAVTCPGSVITCQCVEAVASLRWTVLPGEDCTVGYSAAQPIPQVGAVAPICNDGHTVVFDSLGANNIGTAVFGSSLNAVVQENVTVTCMDTFGPVTTTITVLASKLTCYLLEEL